MPISAAVFVRSTIIMMMVGLAALLAVVVATLWLADRTQVYVEEVVRVREVRSGAADLLSLLQDAETGQRGYLLTGEESYLVPYLSARDRIGAAVATVRRRVRSKDVEEALARIDRAVSDKMAELGQTVDLARAGHRDEAMRIVMTDRGRDVMDTARTLIGGLVEVAETRLAERVADQRGSAAALRWVTIAGAVLIILVVGGCVVTVVRYTRDLVAAQLELGRLNAGLEQRVRDRTADLSAANEEIQRYAYIVSHDLRAPLVNVMGYTSEIEAVVGSLRAYLDAPADRPDPAVEHQARIALEADLPEALGFIRSSTDRMDRLINAILKLSREGRRTLKPERIDLGALLDGTAATVSHRLAESGGALTVEGKPPPIVSDRLALEQIFGNIVDNAVKYGDPSRPAAIVVRTRAEGRDSVVVEVSDNGRGIAARDHARIFELFRRAGVQDQPGEGIGLAHTLALARRLGGVVTVDSDLGRGTTFRVTLPRELDVAETA